MADTQYQQELLSLSSIFIYHTKEKRDVQSVHRNVLDKTGRRMGKRKTEEQSFREIKAEQNKTEGKEPIWIADKQKEAADAGKKWQALRETQKKVDGKTQWRRRGVMEDINTTKPAPGESRRRNMRSRS